MGLIEDWNTRKNEGRKHKKEWTKLLKRHKGKQLDLLAASTHEEVFSKLDCLDCANCCTSIPPIVTKTDSARLAKHLRIKVSEFEKTYLTQDEDGDQVMRTSPCPFLQEDHKCLVYEYRPKACRQYPHTDEDFSKNINLHIQNTRYCPAVYHILNRMVHQMK